VVWIGIDPGLSGALAVLPDGPIEFFDTPITTVKSGKKMRNQMNASAIRLILESIIFRYGGNVSAVIEKVSAMPSTHEGDRGASMGATSAFNYGKGVGIWIGLLAGCQIPYEEVHPATWKALLMRDMGKGKDAGIVKATQLFPSVAKDLTRKKDHGRADALLLAYYGKRVSTMPVIPRRAPRIIEPELSLF
jgi:hypothetical protein